MNIIGKIEILLWKDWWTHKLCTVLCPYFRPIIHFWTPHWNWVIACAQWLQHMSPVATMTTQLVSCLAFSTGNRIRVLGRTLDDPATTGVIDDDKRRWQVYWLSRIDSYYYYYYLYCTLVLKYTSAAQNDFWHTACSKKYPLGFFAHFSEMRHNHQYSMAFVSLTLLHIVGLLLVPCCLIILWRIEMMTMMAVHVYTTLLFAVFMRLRHCIGVGI